MKLRLQLKMLIIQIIFEWMVSMIQRNKDKTLFQVFLQIHEWFLNTQTAKDVCLRFPSIIQFLQYSSHFLLLIEVRNIFIWFYNKSTQHPVCVHTSVCFPQFAKIGIQILVLLAPKKLLLILFLLPLLLLPIIM